MSRDNVSIIIPCFDADQTVTLAIQSALCQEGVECEIVAIDDGSKDQSVSVLRKFEPRVRLFTGPNCGVSYARNRGISETSGKLIVFLDADDLLLSDTLEKRLLTAASTGADVVICDWQDFDAGGIHTHVRSVDWAALEANAEIACATDVWATTAAIMYRRTLIEQVGGFRADLPVIQDARLLFDVARAGAKFAHSPHIGALYSVSQQSLSRRFE